MDRWDFSGRAPLVIGSTLTSATTAYALYDGLIDEPTLYNRALTPSEIANLYAAGASGKFGLMYPPDAALVSTNYPLRRAPVGAQVYVPGQATNSFLGGMNWQSGGLIFRALSNSTPVGLSPVLTGLHTYQFIRTNLTWAEAQLTAASLSTTGLVAHLATITSPEENEFIRQRFATNAGSALAWIGGRKPQPNRACTGVSDRRPTCRSRRTRRRCRRLIMRTGRRRAQRPDQRGLPGAQFGRRLQRGGQRAMGGGGTDQQRGGPRGGFSGRV